MTRDEALRLPAGALLWTPFEPKALVRLCEVEDDTARIEFTHNHRGYPQGSFGRYYLNELTPAESTP